MLNKKARISFLFIIIVLASVFIWFYFKDFKTAFAVFLVYVAVRIIANFLKRKPRGEYYE